MNRRLVIFLVSLAILLAAFGCKREEAPPPSPPPAATEQAPVAGTASGVIGVTVAELEMVSRGWSAEKQVLDKKIVNENNETIGELEDVIITPDQGVSYGIVEVGGFLGMGEHRVAIPFKQLNIEGEKIILKGATKEALTAVPEFKYARS